VGKIISRRKEVALSRIQTREEGGEKRRD